MKILILGDLHFTIKQPGSRLDDIREVFHEKIREICNLAQREKVDVVVQPGDFFDSHKANDESKSTIIGILNQYFPTETKLLTIFGQHDQRFHQANVLNTPLHLLASANYVEILNRIPFNYPSWIVDFYGASWNEEIPEPENTNNFNVLVLHRMVIKNKLWEQQEDFIQDSILLKTHPEYDLIISGDNHTGFTAKSGNRYLVNAGCLVRTNIGQEDHQPSVYIFDTVTRELQQHRLSIRPFEEVIRIEEAKREKTENDTLNQYAEALKSNTKLTGIKYRENLHNYIEKNKAVITHNMREFIEKVFRKADGNDQFH